MRKFKVRYQKTHIVLNQMTIEVVEEEIQCQMISFEDEWVVFENGTKISSFIVKAFMRATVFTVEEIGSN